MRSALLVVVTLVLAGCSDPEAEDPAPADKELEPQPEPNLGLTSPTAEDVPLQGHFEATYPLTETDVSVLGGHNSAGSNCIMFDDDAVISGTATVTWSATPATPTMELVLATDDETLVASGDGSITLDLRGVRVEREQIGGDPLAWQVSADEPAGVAAQLEGTLVLSLDYVLEGNGKFEPDDNWGCAIGH